VYRVSTEEVGQGDDDQAGMQISHAQHEHVDTRIRWVYFMLGAATLLSWNGMSRKGLSNQLMPDRNHPSIDQCESIFYFAAVGFSIQTIV